MVKIFIVFLALMGGAIAFAGWLSSGTGASGSVDAGSATPLVVTPGVLAINLTSGTSKPSTSTITLSMDNTSASGCQTAVFTPNITATTS